MSDPPIPRANPSVRSLRTVMSNWRVFTPEEATPPVPAIPTVPSVPPVPPKTEDLDPTAQPHLSTEPTAPLDPAPEPAQPASDPPAPVRPEPYRIPTRGGTEQSNWPWSQGVIPSMASQQGWLASLFSRQNQTGPQPRPVSVPAQEAADANLSPSPDITRSPGRIPPSASDLSAFGDATSRLATGQLTSSPLPGGRARVETSLINPSISNSTVAPSPRPTSSLVDYPFPQMPTPDPDPLTGSPSSATINALASSTSTVAPRPIRESLNVEARPTVLARNSTNSGVSAYSNQFEFSSPNATAPGDTPDVLPEEDPDETVSTSYFGAGRSARRYRSDADIGPSITVDAGTPEEDEHDFVYDVDLPSPVYTDSLDTLDVCREDLLAARAKRLAREDEAKAQLDMMDRDNQAEEQQEASKPSGAKGKEKEEPESKAFVIQRGLSRFWAKERASPDLELGLPDPFERIGPDKGKGKAVAPSTSRESPTRVTNLVPLAHPVPIPSIGLLRKFKNATTERPKDIGKSFMDLGPPPTRPFSPATGAVTRKLSFRKPPPVDKSYIDMGKKRFRDPFKRIVSDKSTSTDGSVKPAEGIWSTVLRRLTGAKRPPQAETSPSEEPMLLEIPRMFGADLGRYNTHTASTPDLLAHQRQNAHRITRPVSGLGRLYHPFGNQEVPERQPISSAAEGAKDFARLFKGNRGRPATAGAAVSGKRLSVQSQVSKSSGKGFLGLGPDLRGIPAEGRPRDAVGRAPKHMKSEYPVVGSSLDPYHSDQSDIDRRVSRASSGLEPPERSGTTSPPREAPRPQLISSPPGLFVNPIDPAVDPELHQRVWEFHVHQAYEDQRRNSQSPRSGPERSSYVEALTAVQLAAFPLPPTHGEDEELSRSPPVPGRSSSLADRPTVLAPRSPLVLPDEDPSKGGDASRAPAQPTSAGVVDADVAISLVASLFPEQSVFPLAVSETPGRGQTASAPPDISHSSSTVPDTRVAPLGAPARIAAISPPAFVPLPSLRDLAAQLNDPPTAPTTLPPAVPDDSPTLSHNRRPAAKTSVAPTPGQSSATPNPLASSTTPSTGTSAGRSVWFTPVPPRPTGLPPSARMGGYMSQYSQPRTPRRKSSRHFNRSRSGSDVPDVPPSPLVIPFPARITELEPHVIFEGDVRQRVDPQRHHWTSGSNDAFNQAEKVLDYSWVPYRMVITTAFRPVDVADDESDSERYEAVAYLHFFHPAGVVKVEPIESISSSGERVLDMPDIRDIYGPEAFRLQLSSQFRAIDFDPSNTSISASACTTRWREEDSKLPILRTGCIGAEGAWKDERYLAVPDNDERIEWRRHIQDERDYRLALINGVADQFRDVLQLRDPEHMHESTNELTRMLEEVHARRQARQEAKQIMTDLPNHRPPPPPPRSTATPILRSGQRPPPAKGILRKRGSTGAIGIANEPVRPDWKYMREGIQDVGDYIEIEEEDSRQRNKMVEESLARHPRKREATGDTIRPTQRPSTAPDPPADTEASTGHVAPQRSESTASMSMDEVKTYWEKSTEQEQPSSTLGLTGVQSSRGRFTGRGRLGSYAQVLPPKREGRSVPGLVSSQGSGVTSGRRLPGSASNASSTASSRSSSRRAAERQAINDEITPALSGRSLGSSTDMVLTESEGHSASAATSPDNVYTVLPNTRTKRPRAPRPPTPPRKSREPSPDSPSASRARQDSEEDFRYGVARDPYDTLALDAVPVPGPPNTPEHMISRTKRRLLLTSSPESSSDEGPAECSPGLCTPETMPVAPKSSPQLLHLIFSPDLPDYQKINLEGAIDPNMLTTKLQEAREARRQARQEPRRRALKPIFKLAARTARNRLRSRLPLRMVYQVDRFQAEQRKLEKKLLRRERRRAAVQVVAEGSAAEAPAPVPASVDTEPNTAEPISHGPDKAACEVQEGAACEAQAEATSEVRDEPIPITIRKIILRRNGKVPQVGARASRKVKSRKVSKIPDNPKQTPSSSTSRNTSNLTTPTTPTVLRPQVVDPSIRRSSRPHSETWRQAILQRRHNKRTEAEQEDSESTPPITGPGRRRTRAEARRAVELERLGTNATKDRSPSPDSPSLARSRVPQSWHLENNPSDADRPGSDDMTGPSTRFWNRQRYDADGQGSGKADFTERIPRVPGARRPLEGPRHAEYTKAAPRSTTATSFDANHLDRAGESKMAIASGPASNSIESKDRPMARAARHYTGFSGPGGRHILAAPVGSPQREVQYLSMATFDPLSTIPLDIGSSPDKSEPSNATPGLLYCRRTSSPRSPRTPAKGVFDHESRRTPRYESPHSSDGENSIEHSLERRKRGKMKPSMHSRYPYAGQTDLTDDEAGVSDRQRNVKPRFGALERPRDDEVPSSVTVVRDRAAAVRKTRETKSKCPHIQRPYTEDEQQFLDGPDRKRITVKNKAGKTDEEERERRDRDALHVRRRELQWTPETLEEKRERARVSQRQRRKQRPSNQRQAREIEAAWSAHVPEPGPSKPFGWLATHSEESNKEDEEQYELESSSASGKDETETHNLSDGRYHALPAPVNSRPGPVSRQDSSDTHPPPRPERAPRYESSGAKTSGLGRPGTESNPGSAHGTARSGAKSSWGHRLDTEEQQSEDSARSHQQKSESEIKEEARRAKNREYKRKWRNNLSPSSKARTRAKIAEYDRNWKNNLSPSSKARKLARKAECARNRLAKLSPNSKARRLAKNREYEQRNWRNNQSPSSKARRLAKTREYERNRRNNLSPSSKARHKLLQYESDRRWREKHRKQEASSTSEKNATAGPSRVRPVGGAVAEGDIRSSVDEGSQAEDACEDLDASSRDITPCYSGKPRPKYNEKQEFWQEDWFDDM